MNKPIVSGKNINVTLSPTQHGGSILIGWWNARLLLYVIGTINQGNAQVLSWFIVSLNLIEKMNGDCISK